MAGGDRRARAGRPSATERAYEYAKAQIISCAFPPGELITEGQVSEALEVSRTPVREAFMLLAAEGFLRLYPKRGALVVPVTWVEVDEVLEARRLVERWAVEQLIAMRPAGLESRLRAALDDLERALHAAYDSSTRADAPSTACWWARRGTGWSPRSMIRSSCVRCA